MRFYCTILLVLISVAVQYQDTIASSPPNRQKSLRMVVLHSYDSELPWVKSTTDGLRETVKGIKGVRFSLYIEHLDLARENQPEYRQKIKEVIHLKYRDKQPDIVLCIDTLATRFFHYHKSDLFPDVPAIFSITKQPYRQVKNLMPENSAVVLNQVDYAGTLDLALKLFPKTRNIVVINGRTKGGRLSEEKVKQISSRYENSIRFRYLSGLEYGQILKTVETLPEHSIVFQLIFLADINGKKHIPAQVVEEVSQRACAPVFSLYEPMIGHGTIGGRMVSPLDIQGDVVRLAIQLLENPKDTAGTILTTATRPIFDWRQLKKWKVKEKILPWESDIRFRQYSFFQLHRQKVIAGAVLLLLQAVLILFLIINLIRRKKTEASLLESRKQLEESLEELSLKNFVLENAPVSVIWLDSTGHIFYANKMAARSRGYTQQEILGLNIWDIDLKLTKERFAEFWHQMEDGIPLNSESVHIRKDGSVFPIEVHARQNTYKNQRLNFGFVYDISKRKIAEENLKISEDRHRSIVRSAMDGFMITDFKGRLTQVNPAYCQMLGYTEKELLSMSIKDVEALFTEDEIQSQIAEIVQQGQIRFESRHRHKSGRILDVELSSQYQASHGENLFYFIRDLTEQKQVQSALQQSQKMEAVGTLAGGIAHDFNNILGAIIGYADLIRHRYKDNNDLIRHVEQILHAGRRAKGLVMQILLFSRKSDQQSIPLDIQPMVKEIIRLLQVTLPPGIEIEPSFTTLPGKILADPDQIHQIIMNLCTNAIYAMEDKGVLSIELEEVLLDDTMAAALPGLQPGRFIRLKISDTGCGIPSEIVDQIFDPFFTTKPQGKGTGLGLSVVHGILKSHGGAVKVYSEPGQGTTFNIFLPVSQDGDAIEPAADKIVPTGSETILLVDDETALVDVAKTVLERLGYTIQGFSDSQKAWQHFKRNPGQFDLVLTDKNMPGLTGIQLAEMVQAICPGIPIIMCTGFFDAPAAELAEKAGILDILNKPVLTDELAIAIRGALSNQREQ